jgi:hypothetical protein
MRVAVTGGGASRGRAGRRALFKYADDIHQAKASSVANRASLLGFRAGVVGASA